MDYQYLVSEIDEARAQISRDELRDVLWAENILARRYFYPGCHRMEPYRSRSTWESLPNTERLPNRVLCLPTGIAVEPQDIARMCQIIRFVIARGDEIRKRLAGAATPTLGPTER